MGCRYVLFGRTFDNIEQLDDFLLSREELRKEVGDEIYSASIQEVQRVRYGKLYEEGNKFIKKRRMASQGYGNVWVRERTEFDPSRIDMGFDPDEPLEPSYVYTDEYLGVTSAIQQLVDPMTKSIITPQFIKDNYFDQLMAQFNAKAFGDGSFWKPEDLIMLFGDGTNDYDYAVQKASSLTLDSRDPKTGMTQRERIKKAFEKKWEYQAKYGNAVHDIMQAYFTAIVPDPSGAVDKDGKPRGTILRYLPKEQRADALKKIIRQDTFYTNAYFNNRGERWIPGQAVEGVSADLISDADVESIAKIAESLYDSLLNTFGTDEDGKENFTLFSEFPIIEDSTVLVGDYKGENIKQRRLAGAIDLMVVTNDGTPHIIDFKTSTHDYMVNGKENWSTAKMNTYTYQLGIYRQILARREINTASSGLYIAPIVVGQISMEEDGKGNMTFKNAPIDASRNGYGLRDIGGRIASSYTVRTEINRILPPPPTLVEIDDEEHLIENTKKDYDVLFGEYDYSVERVTPEFIAKQIKDFCEVDQKTGKWTYYMDKNHSIPRRIGTSRIEGKTEEEIAAKVKEYHTNKDNNRQTLTSYIVEQVRSTKESGDNYAMFDNATYKNKINNLLGKYYSPNWIIPKGQEKYNAMGFIIFKDQKTQRIDIVCITNEDPYTMRKMKKGSLLSANLYSDIKETSRNSKMLAAAEGNFEMMRALTMLNRANKLFDDGSYIGSIRVFDTESGKTMYASNSQLKYSFTTIAKATKDNDGNQIIPVNRKVKLADDRQIVLSELQNVQERLNEEKSMAGAQGRDYRWSDMFRNKDVRNTIFFGDDQQSLSSKLTKDGVTKYELQKGYEGILETLTSYYPELQKVGEGDFTTQGVDDDIRRLYISVANAISELNGININQQLFDSNKYSQFGIFKSLKRGYTSTSVDNPGMMYSQMLNSVTNAFQNAYQNIRDKMVSPLAKFNELEQRMMKACGKNHMLTLDRENLWKEFYETDSKGNITPEFRFKKPEEIEDPTKREILRELLIEINRYRFSKNDQLVPRDKVEEFKNDDAYYNVPAVRKQWIDNYNTVHNNGGTWMERMRNAWNTISSVKEIRKLIAGKLSNNDEETRRRRKTLYNDADIFNMSTNMAISDKATGADRIEAIQKIGLDNLTFNASLAGATKVFDTVSKSGLQRAMLLAKCAIMHLRSEGQLMDFNYENDIEYLLKYVKGTIKNEDLNDPALAGLERLVSEMSRWSSFAVLGMSPVQITYQTIQGLMQGAVITAKKALGDQSFGAKEFMDAAKEVYSDVGRDATSKVALFNQMEGINDMDMNDYVKHAQDRKNIRSTEAIYKLGMMTSSRPDYYNRMTVFVAQAMKDDVWDAYERTDDGKLVYHFNQDGRFKRLSGNHPKDDAYYKELGLYRAMADRMLTEGATYATDVYYLDKNGNVQKIDAGTSFEKVYSKAAEEGWIAPLPKAYTSQQSDGYKNIADDTYGYYSHEKKAAIHATLFGKMFMQFKTYFSGKKNQYLMTGGVRMRGNYEQLKDNDGNLVFQAGMDEPLIVQKKMPDGSVAYFDIDTNERISDEKVAGLIPFYQWKGQYQEGVIVTIANIVRMAMESDKPVLQALNEARKQYRDAEETHDVYRTNVRQLGHDMFIFIVIGGLVAGMLGDLFDELFKDDDSVPGVIKDMSRIMVRSIENSSMDSNIFGTFWSFFGNWTPFTISYMGKTAQNAWGLISGNKNAFDAACTQFSGLNQIKNTVSGLWEE